MRDEWLNARGAIARFDRSAIEIRIIDVQECPRADLAIAGLVFSTLKHLTEEGWTDYAEQQRWQVETLAALFLATVREGEEALISDPGYLRLFGCTSPAPVPVGRLWQHIFSQLQTSPYPPKGFDRELAVILEQGPLARRIRNRLGNDCNRDALFKIYGDLADCLAMGRMFIA